MENVGNRAEQKPTCPNMSRRCETKGGSRQCWDGGHTHVFPSEKFSEVFSFLSEIFWCDEDIYDKFVKQVFHHANIFLKL